MQIVVVQELSKECHFDPDLSGEKSQGDLSLELEMTEVLSNRGRSKIQNSIMHYHRKLEKKTIISFLIWKIQANLIKPYKKKRQNDLKEKGAKLDHLEGGH